MSNRSSNIQNIEASRSSIEDPDFAAEAAKNQILAQSTTAMLAQALAISQNVLGLLR